MDKWKNYLRSALCSIKHNKVYALFCVVGTAFTFVFIIIMLQLVYDTTSNKAPFVNGDRTIVFNTFQDVNGRNVGGIYSGCTAWLMERIREKEDYFMYYNSVGEVAVNDVCKTFPFAFVNGGYWKVHQFNFVEGRSFTEQECLNKDAYVVLREDMAETFFKSGHAVGQKMEIQGRDYTVIGVVRNFSTYATITEGIWIPYVFNSFSPRGFGHYDLGVLFPRDVSVQNMKESVVVAVKDYWRQINMNVDVKPENLYTFREARIDNFGSDLYAYGIPVAILLLLLIPAINIVTLNMANVDNYSDEIALKRALGAGLWDSFMQVISEIALLVIVGAILGIFLTYPIADWISGSFFNNGDEWQVSLIENLDYLVILCGVFPLSLLFTLLSGGIPAYIIARKNIATVLKGGSK